MAREAPARRPHMSVVPLQVLSERGGHSTIRSPLYLAPVRARFFAGGYVLSIRYLASLHDTAMKYLRFFLPTN